MQALERVPAVSRWTSSIFLSMACAAVLSHLGVLPHACAAYDTVWKVLMPLGTALILLRSPSLFVPLASSVRGWVVRDTPSGRGSDSGDDGSDSADGSAMSQQLLLESSSPPAVSAQPGTWKASAVRSSTVGYVSAVSVSTAVAVAEEPFVDQQRESQPDSGEADKKTASSSRQHVIAFAAATAATVAGTVVAWVLVGRSAVATGAVDRAGMAALASALCASYIGGSVNFAAIIQVLLPALSLGASRCAMQRDR